MTGRGGYSIGFIGATLAWTSVHDAAWWLAVPVVLVVYVAGGVYVAHAMRSAARRRRAAAQGQDQRVNATVTPRTD